MLGYHGTTVETYACCVRFTGDRIPFTARQLRFDNSRDPRNGYHRGVAYHFQLSRAVSDSLNEAFEHAERPLVIAGSIDGYAALTMRFPFGAWFRIEGLYIGRPTWRSLEPLLVWEGEQEFKGHFSYFAAPDLFNRARRRQTHHEKFGPTLEALAKPLLAAQHEAYERARGRAEARDPLPPQESDEEPATIAAAKT
jgi:hypothetical protein